MQKIGVLTGGGDCPGLNAVIRSVVKSAWVKYNCEVLGIEDGFDGLVLPNKTRNLTLLNVHGILPIGGTILGTSNRANPFEYKVTINGKPEARDVSKDVIKNIQSLGLDALVVIGGDGSLNIAHELFKMGCPIVGVQKPSTTISWQLMLPLDLTPPCKRPQRHWIDFTPLLKATTGSWSLR